MSRVRYIEDSQRASDNPSLHQNPGARVFANQRNDLKRPHLTKDLAAEIRFECESAGTTSALVRSGLGYKFH